MLHAILCNALPHGCRSVIDRYRFHCLQLDEHGERSLEFTVQMRLISRD